MTHHLTGRDDFNPTVFDRSPQGMIATLLRLRRVPARRCDFKVPDLAGRFVA